MASARCWVGGRTRTIAKMRTLLCCCDGGGGCGSAAVASAVLVCTCVWSSPSVPCIVLSGDCCLCLLTGCWTTMWLLWWLVWWLLWWLLRLPWFPPIDAVVCTVQRLVCTVPGLLSTSLLLLPLLLLSLLLFALQCCAAAAPTPRAVPCDNQNTFDDEWKSNRNHEV